MAPTASCTSLELPGGYEFVHFVPGKPHDDEWHNPSCRENWTFDPAHDVATRFGKQLPWDEALQKIEQNTGIPFGDRAHITRDRLNDWVMKVRRSDVIDSEVVGDYQFDHHFPKQFEESRKTGQNWMFDPAKDEVLDLRSNGYISFDQAMDDIEQRFGISFGERNNITQGRLNEFGGKLLLHLIPQYHLVGGELKHGERILIVSEHALSQVPFGKRGIKAYAHWIGADHVFLFGQEGYPSFGEIFDQLHKVGSFKEVMVMEHGGDERDGHGLFGRHFRHTPLLEAGGSFVVTGCNNDWKSVASQYLGDIGPGTFTVTLGTGTNLGVLWYHGPLLGAGKGGLGDGIERYDVEQKVEPCTMTMFGEVYPVQCPDSEKKEHLVTKVTPLPGNTYQPIWLP